jgi:hypothetical protein
VDSAAAKNGALDQCLTVLRRRGILLQSDPKLPSVTTIVAGEPIRGSWWGHRTARLIYQTLQLLGDHPDVMLIKLVAGKDTFVHRSLWPAIYAIGTAGEPWQRAGLSSAARRLERDLNQAGQLETTGPAAKELRARLLAHGEQSHTASGSHAMQLESWIHWTQRLGLQMERIPPHEARAKIEEALPTAKFPWSGRSPYISPTGSA